MQQIGLRAAPRAQADIFSTKGAETFPVSCPEAWISERILRTCTQERARVKDVGVDANMLLF